MSNEATQTKMTCRFCQRVYRAAFKGQATCGRPACRAAYAAAMKETRKEITKFCTRCGARFTTFNPRRRTCGGEVCEGQMSRPQIMWVGDILVPDWVNMDENIWANGCTEKAANGL